MNTINHGRSNPERPNAYRDTGCGGACVRSLDCPYPVCILEDPEYLVKQRRQARDEAVLNFAHNGNNADSIASKMGMNVRTVYRILSDRQNQQIK